MWYPSSQVPLGYRWDSLFPDVPPSPMYQWDDQALLYRWSPQSALVYFERRNIKIGLVVNLTYSRR